MNEGFKRSRSVGEAERHDCIFGKSKMSSEGRFPFIAFFNSDQIDEKVLGEAKRCELDSNI